MHKCFFLCWFLAVVNCVSLKAQDTLPNINVKNLNGRMIISWKNNYAAPVKNINIQRSFDSLKNFTTIGSVLNPQNRENGYADLKPPYNKMYYRVFVAFEGGSYIYSVTRRPVKDTANRQQRIDSFVVQEVIPKPAGWAPSKKIYTNNKDKDYSVVINLPDAAAKKYSIKFFDEEETLVFEVSKLPESYLVLEKVNFGHAGWFFFELYESGTLVEKNKFFVPKDGKNTVLPYETQKKNNK